MMLAALLLAATVDPPDAHPDFPAPPLCDPMPMQVDVCHWAPQDPMSGVGCPEGYVRLQTSVQMTCPTSGTTTEGDTHGKQ